MFRLVCLCIGYFIGCIQTAYIVGKLVAHIDIRDHGSGNAGTTNATRVLGTKLGLLVFVCDILKAVVAYVLCALLFKGDGTFLSYHTATGVLPGFYASIGVILGHNFPFFLKFKGGKGSASGLGLFLALDLQMALIAYLVGIIIVASTRYISLASLLITFTVFVLLIIFGYSMEPIALCGFVLGLSMYQHRGNIVRLCHGEERKFTFRPKVDATIRKKSM